MIPLPPKLRFALRANDIARRAARRDDKPDPDPAPVLELFDAMGATTWLATELDEDGDPSFGLADLGFGRPELGSFGLSEIVSVRSAGGLGIERDLGSRRRLRCPARRTPRAVPDRSSGPRPCCAVPQPTSFRRLSRMKEVDDAGGRSPPFEKPVRPPAKNDGPALTKE